jgi:hypothetical protein
MGLLYGLTDKNKTNIITELVDCCSSLRFLSLTAKLWAN